MNLFSSLKNMLLYTKHRIKENRFDSLLWLINMVPNISGFSYTKDKVSGVYCISGAGDRTSMETLALRKLSNKAWFWILHLSLLFYVYVVGIFWYQWRYTQDARDLIKGYVNISIVIIIGSNSWWFVKQRFDSNLYLWLYILIYRHRYFICNEIYRPLLKAVLKKIEQNDQIARRSISLQQEHEKLMQIIKRILLFFYGFNYIDVLFIYWPHRVDILNNYSMTPCVGLEPVTASPNREICLTILALQEFTITIVALNYQSLLLFLIAHTAAMYQMMSYEMTALNDNYNKVENKALAKETLSSLIDRHSSTLEVMDKLKSLYSVPLGINFGTSAVCISLLFALPLQEWLQFMPVLVYCFLVFFLYCFLCQRLINSSEVFERSVYCCGWENFDLREKKLVFVMLRQSQKPVVLFAADIIPVNIATFATTLQTMFKFVTVVKF